MSAKVLGCRELAQKVKDEVAAQVKALRQKYGRVPKLVTILVGDDPASQVYVRNKIKAAEYTGIDGELVTFPNTVSQDELVSAINKLARDPQVSGILVQLPLPEHINSEEIIETIPYYKDVDAFHPINLGRIMRGNPILEPCTPAGIIEIFKHFGISTRGKDVVIIGRSNIVGKPLANMLMQKKEFADATVTVCHTRTRDIGFFTRNADIVIVSSGRPNTLTADMVKEGVVVIDVGINKVPADNEKGYRLVGDAAFDELQSKASAITPVPGGVGLMTVAMLMRNVVKAFELQQKGGNDEV